MTVLITGITGFLGSAVALALSKHGDRVTGTSRKEFRTLPSLPELKISKLDLREIPSSQLLRDLDCIIHCAYDYSPGAPNVEGTKTLFVQAKAAGVRFQLLLSSHSANQNAETDYGRTKFELEQFFFHEQAIVLRPGLVLGPGGLAKKLFRKARQSYFFPVPTGRSATFPYIWVDDFVESVLGILRNGEPGIYNLYYKDFTTLSAIAEAVRRETAYPKQIIRIPLTVLYLCLRTLKSILDPFAVRLPAAAQSVISLKVNQCAAERIPSCFVRRKHLTLQQMVARSLNDVSSRQNCALNDAD